MYIFKNAWTSITRSKGRNILICIIIIVIAASCAITLSIRNSANKIVKSYEESYEVEASISMDRNALMESLRSDNATQEEMINKFNEIEEVTVDEINSYGDSEYVKNYYYVYQTSMNGKDLTEATDQLTKETTTTKTETSSWQRTIPGGGGHGPGGPGGGSIQKGGSTKKTTTTKTEIIRNDRAANGAFVVKGYSSSESMIDFISGNYTIIDGEVSTDFDGSDCVISEELAELNEISVGDTITLVNPDNTKLTYELTVTGIYKENSNTSKDMSNMFTSSANTIITNSNVVEKMAADSEDLSLTVTPTFILTSKDVIEDFTNEVKEKGLSEYYTITNNVDTVESATKSINNVKTFATTFLIITLVIGGVVLFVINMINIRERKYEIGVLRTIGMKKSLVVIQFMTELLVVTLFGLLVGAGVGSTCSVKIANSLLANEIANANEEQENISKNFGHNGNNRPSEQPVEEVSEETKEQETESKSTKEEEKIEEVEEKQEQKATRINGTKEIEKIDKINAIVDYKVLLELLGIGVLLTVVSSISACIAIARFQPLQILKERS